MIMDITDSNKAEIPSLAEASTAQSTVSDCRPRFASISILRTFFNINKDVLSVRFSFLSFTAALAMPSSLLLRFLFLAIFLFWSATLVDVVYTILL